MTVVFLAFDKSLDDLQKIFCNLSSLQTIQLPLECQLLDTAATTISKLDTIQF